MKTPKTRKPANPSNLLRKGFAIDQFGKKVINHSCKKWNDPTRISIPDGWERVPSVFQPKTGTLMTFPAEPCPRPKNYAEYSEAMCYEFEQRKRKREQLNERIKLEH